VLQNSIAALPLALGVLAGIVAFVVGLYLARRRVERAHAEASELVADARQEAESSSKELLVATQERLFAQQEEADRRERELHDRESTVDTKATELENQRTEVRRDRKRLDRRRAEVDRLHASAVETEAEATKDRDEARGALERIAGLTAAEARSEMIASIEEQARVEGTRLSRKIIDEARESAERDAVNLMIQAFQRVRIEDVVESTVSFIELPSDEMKGRIIGREGRNIRALEMATGIDLIVDDTPRSILISSFDPVRREVARVSIDRLVEDGEERGTEAAFGLGISDLHPRLIPMVGNMRYFTAHGQNLLQHCVETALIAGHIAVEAGADAGLVRRAGLLHEIGQIDPELASHPILASAETCSRFGESDAVVHAIRSLHPDVEPRSLEALLLNAAGRISDNRPGARKENLAVFIERLRRLEKIATGFDGVKRAFAVKAGKEIRVIVDAHSTSDKNAVGLSKQIARTLERELAYPGQIKVSVVRETRAVRFAV